MIKTHFKRQGSAGLLILKGLPRNYYAEYDHNRGYLKVEEIIEIPKTWNHKTYYETHHKTLLYKNYEKSQIGIEHITDIHNNINEVLSVNSQIEIENYIESYHIAGKEHITDRHILNDIDITDYNTMQTIIKCNINLYEYFEQWHVEKIKEYLLKPTKKMLEMKFSDLYSLIHWNSHKQDFAEIFANGIQ